MKVDQTETHAVHCWAPRGPRKVVRAASRCHGSRAGTCNQLVQTVQPTILLQSASLAPIWWVCRLAQLGTSTARLLANCHDVNTPVLSCAVLSCP